MRKYYRDHCDVDLQPIDLEKTKPEQGCLAREKKNRFPEDVFIPQKSSNTMIDSLGTTG